jgi:hypothetical protein
MPDSHTISLIALVVAILSLGFSVYFNFLDRARMVTRCKFYPKSEYNRAHVDVSITNAGRRAVILRMIVKADGRGHWVGTYLNRGEGGLRLGEHQRHDLTLWQEDLIEANPDDEIEVTDFWFEDTLGRRHRPKRIRQCLKQLWAS